jgi:hypothetical protein
MPTILPGDLAEAWLYKDLSDQEIVDIGNYQVSSVDMKAWPLHKDFLKEKTRWKKLYITKFLNL